VAGAYHDHIFVHLELADAAMHVLHLLQTDGVTGQPPANIV
jgi:hypothetical protein